LHQIKGDYHEGYLDGIADEEQGSLGEILWEDDEEIIFCHENHIVDEI
jgi:hypothetical protein